LTTDELIRRAARKAEVNLITVQKVYAVLVSEIKAALVSDDDVRLHGIGILKVKDAPERTGRNPKTQEPVIIPARRRVSFKATKGLF